MLEIKNYGNLVFIQINIFTKETLSDYFKKVSRKACDILFLLNVYLCFSECCPLCGGKECAVFIKYYYREVIDEKGTYYKNFPIARYLCRRKGHKSITHHKTFSLLPYQLIPYSKYSIQFIIKTLEARHIKGLSIYKLQEYLDTFSKTTITIGAEHLIGFKRLIKNAIDKIMMSQYYQEFEAKVRGEGTEQGLLRSFLEFIQTFECFKIKPSIRGPCALGYDYYLQGGGYFSNAYFLFGTPSQFRT